MGGGCRVGTGGRPAARHGCARLVLVAVKCHGGMFGGVIPQLPTVLGACGVVIRLAGAACARPRTGLLLIGSAQVD